MQQIFAYWFVILQLILERIEYQEDSLGQEDPLQKETATRLDIFAWRIPWTEEPGGL